VQHEVVGLPALFLRVNVDRGGNRLFADEPGRGLGVAEGPQLQREMVPGPALYPLPADLADDRAGVGTGRR